MLRPQAAMIGSNMIRWLRMVFDLLFDLAKMTWYTKPASLLKPFIWVVLKVVGLFSW